MGDRLIGSIFQRRIEPYSPKTFQTNVVSNINRKQTGQNQRIHQAEFSRIGNKRKGEQSGPFSAADTMQENARAVRPFPPIGGELEIWQWRGNGQLTAADQGDLLSADSQRPQA
jgi:hypothetical protein